MGVQSTRWIVGVALFLGLSSAAGAQITWLSQDRYVEDTVVATPTQWGQMTGHVGYNTVNKVAAPDFGPFIAPESMIGSQQSTLGGNQIVAKGYGSYSFDSGNVMFTESRSISHISVTFRTTEPMQWQVDVQKLEVFFNSAGSVTSGSFASLSGAGDAWSWPPPFEDEYLHTDWRHATGLMPAGDWTFTVDSRSFPLYPEGNSAASPYDLSLSFQPAAVPEPAGLLSLGLAGLLLRRRR